MDIESKSLNKLKKGKNNLRFKSFSDRIKLVNISIATRSFLPRYPVLKGQTHFSATFTHICQTELSAPFKELKSELRQFWPFTADTLISNKTEIIEMLLSGLSPPKNKNYISPISDLIVSLGQDLTQNFPSFDKVFSTLLSLIKPNQPEVIEMVHSTICQLIKFIEKSLINFELSSSHLMPHLLSPKPHVRDFVSQTMVYFLKKSSDIRSNLLFLFKNSLAPSSDTTPAAELCARRDGLSSLLFHLVKGPLLGFSVDSKAIFSAIFDVLVSSLTEPNFEAMCGVYELFAGKCAKRLKSRERKKETKMAGDKRETAFCEEIGERVNSLEANGEVLPQLVYFAVVRVCVDCWKDYAGMEENIILKKLMNCHILPNLTNTQNKLKSRNFSQKPLISPIITKILLKLHFCAEDGTENIKKFISDDFFDIDAILDYIAFTKPAQNYISHHKGFSIYAALISRFDRSLKNGHVLKPTHPTNGDAILTEKTLKLLKLLCNLKEMPLLSKRLHFSFNDEANLADLKLCDGDLLSLWAFSEFSLFYKKQSNFSDDAPNYVAHFIKNKNEFLSDRYAFNRDTELALIIQCNFYRSAVINLAEEIDVSTSKSVEAQLKNFEIGDVLDYINKSLNLLETCELDKKPLSELAKEVMCLVMKLGEANLKSDFAGFAERLRNIAFGGLKGHCFGAKICFVEVLISVESVLSSFGETDEMEFFGNILSKIKHLFSLTPDETNEKLILKLTSDISTLSSHNSHLKTQHSIYQKTLFPFFFGLLKTPYASFWKPSIIALKKLEKTLFLKPNKRFIKHETLFQTINSSLSIVLAKSKLKYSSAENNGVCLNPLWDMFKATKEVNKQCRAVSLAENCFALMEAVPSLAQKSLKKYLIAVLSNFIAAKPAENDNFSDFCRVWSEEALEEAFLYQERRENVINLIGPFIRVLAKIKNLADCEEGPFVKKLVAITLEMENQNIQKASLETLFLFRDEKLKNYEDFLLKLIKGPKMIKTAFKLRNDKTESAASLASLVSSDVESKKPVLGILFKIVVPKIFVCQNKNSPKSLSDKNSIFIFLSSLQDADLYTLSLKIFQKIAKTQKFSKNALHSLSNDKTALNLFATMQKYFRSLCRTPLFKTEFLTFLFQIFERNADLVLAKSEIKFSKKEMSKSRKICALSLGRLYEFLKNCSAETEDINEFILDGEQRFVKDFFGFIEKMIENGENVVGFSFSKKEKGAVDLIKLVCEKEALVRKGYWRFVISDSIFPTIINMLKTTESQKVCGKLSNTIINLIALISGTSSLETEAKEQIKNAIVGRISDLLRLVEESGDVNEYVKKKGDLSAEQRIIKSIKSKLILHIGFLCTTPSHFEAFSKLILTALQKSLSKGKKPAKATFEGILRTCEAIPAHDDYKYILLSFWEKLSPLFAMTEGATDVKLLTELFSKFSVKLGLPEIAKLIVELNAFETNKINEEIDFDLRLKAYSRLNAFFGAKNANLVSLLPLTQIFLRDLSSADFGLRIQSVSALSHFVISLGSFGENKSDFESFLRKWVVPILLKKMKINNCENAKIGVVRVVKAIVLNSDRLFNDLKILINTDPQQEFFENIFHIQTHIKIRMLHKLQKLAESNSFSPFSASNFLFPLVLHFVLHSSQYKQAKLIDEGIKTLGDLAKNLNWFHLMKWTNFFMKNLKEKNSDWVGKILVRCFRVVLDNGALKRDHINVIGLNDDKEIVGDCDKKECVKAIIQSMINRASSMAFSSERHQKDVSALIENLKPHMRDGRNRELVRVKIVVVLVRLLRLFPSKRNETELNSLVLELCESLSSRQQRARDETRFALSEVIKITNLDQLPQIIRALKRSLTRGYKKQILGYSLHFLLQSAAKWADRGALDFVLGDVVGVLFEDVFGDTAQEREVDKIRVSMKESRSVKSGDTFRVLAQQMDFSQKINLIVGPILRLFFAKYGETPPLKEQSKLTSIFDLIAKGLSENTKAISSPAVLIYVSKVLTDWIDTETKAKNKESEIEKIPISAQKGLDKKPVFAEDKSGNEPNNDFSDQKVKFLKCEFIGSFALNVFSKFLKRNKRALAPFWPDLMNFEPLLIAFLDSFAPKSTKIAAKLISLCSILFSSFSLFKAKKTDFNNLATRMTHFCFQFLMSQKTKTEASSAYSLLAHSLGESSGIRLSADQIELLMAFVEEHLDDAQMQSMAFSMLKSILGRKKSHAKLYALMDRVIGSMVQCGDDGARREISNCAVLFLINYPLTEQKLTKHVQYLVSNFSFELPSGRHSAVKTLQSFLRRAPDRVLAAFFDKIVYPLVTALANEEDGRCQKTQKKALAELFKRSPPNETNPFLQNLVQWAKSDDANVVCAALKASAALWPVIGGDRSRPVLSEIRVLVRRGSEDLLERALGASDDNSVRARSLFAVFKVRPEIGKNLNFVEGFENWKPLYLSLNCVKKAIKQIEKTESEMIESDFLEDTLSLLRYDHFWVRSEALNVFLSVLNATAEKVAGKLVDSFIAQNWILSSVSSSSHFDSEFGETLVQTLVALAKIRRRSSDGNAKIASVAKLAKMAKKGNMRIKECFLAFVGEIIKTFTGDEMTDGEIEIILNAIFVINSRRASDKNVNREMTESLSLKAMAVAAQLRDSVGESRFAKLSAELSAQRDKAAAAKKRKRDRDRVARPAKHSADALRRNRRKQLSRQRHVKAMKDKRIKLK